MRFCFVNTFYPPYHFGGDAVYVRSIAHALVERGHSVDVVHNVDAYSMRIKQEPAAMPDDPGITVHRLRSNHPVITSLLTQQTGMAGYFSRQLHAVLDCDFDVINYGNISLVGGLGVLSMGHAPIKLYTTHEHWLVCAAHVLWKNKTHACDSRQCLRCSIKSGIPPQLWRYTSYLSKQMRNINLMLCASKFTMQQHADNGIETPMRQLPLFSGLDPGPLPAKPARQRPLFLFVGRIIVSKGIRELLSAFAKLPEYDLQVIGAGDLLEECQAKYGHLPHIQFLGKKYHHELVQHFHEARALMFPSTGPEVAPLTVLESFACATPVIALDFASTTELIENTRGGITYRNEEQMIAAVHELARDPDKAAQLGQAGRDGYLREYTRDVHVDRYLRIVESLQEKKGLRHPPVEARRNENPPRVSA